MESTKAATPSAGKEHTCASCGCCSLSGNYCELWMIPTYLTFGCPQHTGLRKNK